MATKSVAVSPSSAPLAADTADSTGDLRAMIPLAAAATATTLGGMAIVGTRFIVGQTDPLTLAFLRYGIAALCFLPFTIIYARQIKTALDFFIIAGLGLLYFGVHPLAFTAALKFTNAAHGGLVISITPMLTLLLSAAVRYETITARKFLGVVTALAGVGLALIESALAAKAGSQAWIGNLLMFGAATIGAAYNVMSRAVLVRYPAMAVISIGMTTGATALFALVAANGFLTAPPHFSGSNWVIIVCLGAFGAALAFFLLVWALKHTAPTRVAVFLTLNPVVAMVMGALLLGEQISALQIAGLVLVIAGIAIVNFKGPK